MKKKALTILLALATAVSAVAETNTTQTLTLENAVAASGWTVEELVAALDLMEAKYNRDVSTASGRIAWHGKKVGEAVDTNTLTKVTYYEDGTTFTDAAKITKASDATSVREANAKLPKPVMTNGIPARLAAARLRQRENETTVSNVTVNVMAGN